MAASGTSATGWAAFRRGLAGREADERAEAVARRWSTLPPEVRVLPDQFLGRVTAGCTATWGVQERCDFSCTACYLGREANQTPPLPFEEVRRQLEAIARWVGPGGPVQITAGEVTLLPVDALVRIVRTARALRLDPMVMSHGQTFDRDPSYLERLVREGGLSKVAIHVDSTQRGRRGVPKDATEAELDRVRRRFADLVRTTRARTRRPLFAALTATITPDNLDEVPRIVRFALAHADAFRMLSLQPVAPVGRTRVVRDRAEAGGPTFRQEVWARVRAGVRVPRLNPHTFQIGHPGCNDLSLFWVVRFGDETRIVEARREGRALDDAFFRRLPEQGLGRLVPDAASWPEQLGRVLGLVRRSPSVGATWPLYGLRRLAEVPWWPAFLAAVARGEPWQVRPFALVAHHFMAPEELATPEGQARLRACNFRVPVGDRMVPMCEMNAGGIRDAASRAQREGAPGAVVPLVPRPRDPSSAGAARP